MPSEVPFLSDRLCLATGPIALAMKTGAALVPVHALVSRSTDHDFDVIVDAPLTPAVRSEEIPAVAAEYARRVAPLVKERPAEWRGWHNLVPRGGAAEWDLR